MWGEHYLSEKKLNQGCSGIICLSKALLWKYQRMTIKFTKENWVPRVIQGIDELQKKEKMDLFKWMRKNWTFFIVLQTKSTYWKKSAMWWITLSFYIIKSKLCNGDRRWEWFGWETQIKNILLTLKIIIYTEKNVLEEKWKFCETMYVVDWWETGTMNVVSLLNLRDCGSEKKDLQEPKKVELDTNKMPCSSWEQLEDVFVQLLQWRVGGTRGLCRNISSRFIEF